MTNTNTSKDIKKSPSGALRGSEVKKKTNNEESESLEKPKEYLIEVQSKSRTPNNPSPQTTGPMFDEIEVERRENYQFNNYLR